jgi:hypothetical protein
MRIRSREGIDGLTANFEEIPEDPRGRKRKMSQAPPKKRRRKMQNGGDRDSESGQDTKRSAMRGQQAADPTIMPQVHCP